MRRLSQVVVVLLLVVLVGGLFVTLLDNAANAASVATCQTNLKFIGAALHNYHDYNKHFPVGTVSNPDLDPDRRLGWVTEVWPTFMEAKTSSGLDRAKAWDAEENQPPHCRTRIDSPDKNLRVSRVPVGELRVFFCPANKARTAPPMASSTHYVGIAGVGADAASLPLADPKAGFFGYDRRISLADLKDGPATTLALAEVVDGGPWTAGGHATVRGLSAGSPYLGEGGQFSAIHRTSKFSSSPVVINVLFSDGSVRRLTAAVSPEVFEALATIAGNEPVGPMDGE